VFKGAGLKWSDVSRASLAATYFFLIMCTYYMLKPLRDSGFLSEFHAGAKPIFNLATMAILFFAAGAYSSIVKRIKGTRFLHLFFTIMVVSLLLFRFFIEDYPRLMGALFYTWLSCANVFMVMVFWTQVNSTFTAKKDRLLYVLIGLGGGLGAAFGGKITEAIVPLIGPNNLIYSSISVLTVAYLCSLAIARTSGKEPFVIPEVEKDLAGFQGLMRDRYALCILAIVVIGTFVQTIYDYQLTAMVEQTIGKDKAHLAVFYGGLYARMNMFAFLAQILIGPVLVLRMGPAKGMYGLLALIFTTSIILLYNSSLPAMEWVFIVFAGSGYSVMQVLREQLYVPASHSVKIGAKGFIDTFGYRAGDAFAAVAFFFLVIFMHFDLAHLDYLVIGAGVLAAFIVFDVNRIYRRMEVVRTPPVPTPPG
jgi:AAA family ATP:ADP antiporter